MEHYIRIFKPKYLLNVLYIGIFLYCLATSVFLLRQYQDYTHYNGPNRNNVQDLLMYMTGATIIKDGKANQLYDYQTQLEYQHKLIKEDFLIPGLLAFRTPPITAILYLPFTYLDPTSAFYTLTAINIFLLLIAQYFLFKTFNITLDKFFLFSSFFILFLPIFIGLAMSQISILITLVVSICLYLISKDRFIESGLILIFLFLKPNFITLIPFIFLYINGDTQRKNFLKGLLIGTSVFLLLNILIYGVSFPIDYIKFVFQTEDINFGTSPDQNFNLSSLFWKLTENQMYSGLLNIICSGIIYVLGIVYFYKTVALKKNLGPLIAGVFTLIPLINGHSMISDLVIYTIPIILMFKFVKTKFLFLIMLGFYWVVTWIAVYKLQYLSTIFLFILTGAFIVYQKRYSQ